MSLAESTPQYDLDDKVVDLQLVKRNKNKREIKYKKDGTVKMTKCNKIEGKSSEVYPIKTVPEINSIIKALNNHIANATTVYNKQRWYRNKMLFIIGINLGIRGSDLCELKWSNFFYDDMTFRDGCKIKPIKTKRTDKYVTLFFNDAIKNVILEYTYQYPIKNLDEYMFVTTKGNHIDRATVGKMVKQLAKECGIKYNVNSHSLRKTYGYHVWHNAKDKGEALSVLQYIFGHCSQRDTMRYIGITDENVNYVFQNINLGIAK